MLLLTLWVPCWHEQAAQHLQAEHWCKCCCQQAIIAGSPSTETQGQPAVPRAQSSSKHSNPAQECSAHLDVVLHVPVQNVVSSEQVFVPIKSPSRRPLSILCKVLQDVHAHCLGQGAQCAWSSCRCCNKDAGRVRQEKVHGQMGCLARCVLGA